MLDNIRTKDTLKTAGIATKYEDAETISIESDDGAKMLLIVKKGVPGVAKQVFKSSMENFYNGVKDKVDCEHPFVLFDAYTGCPTGNEDEWLKTTVFYDIFDTPQVLEKLPLLRAA